MAVDKTMRGLQDSSSRTVLIALIGTNLVPLAGVLVFGWSIQGLLVVYWLESGVLGALNLPKILYAHGSETDETRKKARQLKTNGKTVQLPDDATTVPEFPERREENWVVALFFLEHYGMFWVIHGLFVGVLPAFAGGAGFLNPAELPTLLVGVGAAAVSHYISYLGTPVGALVVMIVVKTALDLRGHIQQHRAENPHERLDSRRPS